MRKFIVLLSLAALMAASCGSSYNVASFNVNSANYSQFKTFAFYPIDQSKLPSGINMAVVKLIENAIAQQMEQRGFKAVDENPDLGINIGMVVKQEKNVTANTSYSPGIGLPGYYWGSPLVPYNWGFYPWNSTTSFSVDQYNVGTIMVDVVNFKANQMLWHGSVTGTVQSYTDDRGPQHIDEAIMRLFDRFPVANPYKK